ncbi:hypothetical protein BpHYR1_022965, partial [Brachionus plicatilis]
LIFAFASPFEISSLPLAETHLFLVACCNGFKFNCIANTELIIVFAAPLSKMAKIFVPLIVTFTDG